MSKFTLSTYLMLSVVFILSGIAWVILSQTDNRFGHSVEYSDLNGEQDEILRQYYQLQEKYLPKEKSAALISKPATVAAAPAPVSSETATIAPSAYKAPARGEMWRNNVTNEIEPAEYLRNNPWSPDYQPGY